MRVSMNWLRDLVTLPSSVTTNQVAETLTRAGLQVERIEAIGAEVQGPVVVGKVLEFVAEPQKNGKTIRWCQVDVGEAEPRGIVCGADNFAAGDHVVVALPGAVLPGGFAISARKTYGHVSDGMICAVDELGIGTDHSGIIILPELIDGVAPTLGADAMEVLAARDEVLEIDVTPDVGYGLSMRGIAREVAQGFELDFVDPYQPNRPVWGANGYPVQLTSDKCVNFVAIQVAGVDPSAQSPLWMKARLQAAGMRPISLGVDITNYVMLESGQPLHAYDADKLSGPIVVRTAEPGEKLTTLDEVTRTLDPEDLLITDNSGPIGLAGVMGGASTEISEQTTNIVLEAAHFDPVTIGRAFRRHKLPSEASTRFARGVDPAVPLAAARMAARLLDELGGGTVSTDVTMVGSIPDMPTCRIRADLPAKILGAPISEEQVVEVLEASGVRVQGSRDEETGEWLSLVPPTWRSDLVDPYDYVEEVGRKIGFGVVRPELPRPVAGRGYTFEQRSRQAVLDAVAAAGFTELITLPFIASEDLDKLGIAQDDERRRLVRLANPLADTQPFLRTTLLPGLFQAVARNTSRSNDDVFVFECGSVFRNNDAPAAPMPPVDHRPTPEQIAQVTGNLPDQPRLLAGVVTGEWTGAGWGGPAVRADWRHAVLLAEAAAESLGVTLERRAGQVSPWHPGRCAELVVTTGEETVVVGWAGELHPKVIKAFGLPARTCAVELNLDELIALAPRGGEVSSISPFPMTKEDVALVVDSDIPAASVQQALVDGAGELLESIRLFDVYTGDQVPQGKKSLAFALGFRAADRTLKAAEASAARDAAVAVAAERCGAALRA